MRIVSRALIRVSACLAPRATRARWREEWLAEIDAAAVGGWRLVARSAGAPLDAILIRWTSADVPVRHGWGADVRDAVRALVKTPMQTLTMIGCLAVGAALMVSMFAITHALLGTGKLPGVDDRERIVRVFASTGPGNQFTINWPQFLAATWSMPPPGVEAIGGELGWKFLVRTGQENRESKGAFVTGTFFPIFGTVPAAGRLIGPADDRRDAAPVVVISYGFWMRRFAGDPGVVGSQLEIGTTTCTIVGVGPHGFLGTRVADLGQRPDDRVDLWLPMSLTATWAGFPRATPSAAAADPPLPTSPNASIRISAGAAVSMIGPAMVARLAPGVDRRTAEAQMQVFVPQIAEVGGRRTPRSLGLQPFRVMSDVDDGELALVYTAMFFVPFLVLLIGCANVVGLQRARASWRRHELAVRTSLGASRGRLARLLMIEVFVTAGAASLAAWALTTWVLRYTAMLFPFHAEADWRVFVFALGLPLLITLLIGLVPSWKTAGVNVVSGLKAGSRDGQQGQWRFGRLAVVTQIALSTLLVFAAAVLSRGVARSLQSDADLTDVVVAGFHFNDTDLTRDAQRAAVQSLIQHAYDIAGPDNVALRSSTTGVATIGARRDGFQPDDWIAARAATARLFDLLHLQVVAGRVFGDGEANVMVVDEAFARRFGSAGRIVGESFDVLTDGEAPIGTQGAIPISRRVIGVVRNEKPSTPSADEDPTVYVPLATADLTQVTILVRSANTPVAKRRMSAAAEAVYPTLVPRPLATLEEIRLQRYTSVRWMAQALNAIGSLALMLAVVGLFAMVSATVAQRTGEFGVRLALGAQPASIVAMVLREVIGLSSIGIIAGMALSVPMSSFLRSAFVRHATLADPGGVAIGILSMLGAIVVAAYLPARRAGRVDPLLALRAE